MEGNFENFLKSYMNNDFKKLVKTKEGKMEVDMTSKENFAKFLEEFETEIINVNINLLYAYHQWLTEQK